EHTENTEGNPVFLFSVFSVSSAVKTLNSIKASMQKPSAVIQAAKNPETRALFGFDDVIIALDVLAAPPAGRDALRPPRALDRVFFGPRPHTQRSPAGNDRHDRD